MTQPISLNKFLGLANTQPEPRLPLGALIQADNVLVSDSNGLIAAPGFTKLVDLPIQGSYAPSDRSCLFLVANGDLLRFDGTIFTVLASGLRDEPVYWCEESGERVFCVGAGAYAQIDNHGTVINLNTPQPTGASLAVGAGSLPAGRVMVTFYYTDGQTLSAAHPPLFATVTDNSGLMLRVTPHEGWRAEVYVHHERSGAFLYAGSTQEFIAVESLARLGEPINEHVLDCHSLPANVSNIGFHQGRIVVAEPLQATTKLHFSLPYLFNLFPNEEWFELPDQVTGLCSLGDRLLITARSSIWIYGEGIAKLANYGTPFGLPIVKVSPSECRIWTNRGLCKFDGEGFANLTQEVVSVPPGSGCATQVLDWSGDSYTLVMTNGEGAAYNAAFEV